MSWQPARRSLRNAKDHPRTQTVIRNLAKAQGSRCASVSFLVPIPSHAWFLTQLRFCTLLGPYGPQENLNGGWEDCEFMRESTGNSEAPCLYSLPLHVGRRVQ